MAIKLLTDECLMPFGVHKDKEMQNVPASYLMYLWDKNEEAFRINQLSGNLKSVMIYIDDNMQVLRKEIKERKYEIR